MAQDLPLDYVTLLKNTLEHKVGREATRLLPHSHRASTLRQHQVSWSALRNWMEVSGDWHLTDDKVLSFLGHLKALGLAYITIVAYLSNLRNLLAWRWGIETDKPVFKLALRASFLERPTNLPYLPSWSLEKMLNLLSTPVYDAARASEDCLCEKTLFLLALATGNRVSELHAIFRPAIRLEDSQAILPVFPGFLYKNQRANATPEPIKVVALNPSGSPHTLCPLYNLRKYLEKTDRMDRLFRNPKTRKPLAKSSLAFRICKVIDLADPGKLPECHDVRKTAVSLA